MADPQAPLSREEFQKVQDYVVQTAPEGLPREQFDALIDRTATAFQQTKTLPQLPAVPGKTGAPKAPSLMERMQTGEQARTGAGKEFLTGVAKSAAQTVQGAGKLVRAIPGVGPALSKLPPIPTGMPGPEFGTKDFAATTPTERAGVAAGEAGQFFLPGRALSTVKRALATGSGVLDALVGAAVEGTSAAGVSAAQRGTTTGAGAVGASTAAVTALTGPVLQQTLKTLGMKIEDSLIRARTVDRKNGFNVENVFKYDLGGTLRQTYDKTEQTLNRLSDQLHTMLASQPGSTPINLRRAVYDTAVNLKQSAARQFGSNRAIVDSLTKLLEEIPAVSRSGRVNLADANHVKQALGEMGAWLHDPSGRVFGADAHALETVANEMYGVLKTQIEQHATGDVAAINRSLGDLIPIKAAIIARLPVAARANIVRMGDFFGISSGSIGLMLANRALQSGRVANLAVKASQRAGAAGAAAGRATGAAVSGLEGTPEAPPPTGR